jgi:putative aminopeptidase FrvX
MAVFSEKSMQFLEAYINNASPTGFEKEGQKRWLDYIKPYVHETHLDNYGTAYGIINPGKDFRVVIEGHADEISWFVNYITDTGYIHVIRNGGSDHVIAPSKRVTIHAGDKKITGVFGWPAIHTRTDDKSDVSPSIENIFIDVGAQSREEVIEMGIHVGAVVTYQDQFITLNDGRYLVGRALDNRLGGFCVAEVARLISEKKIELPYSLYIVNAVQEEIGLKGAEMIAHTIKPDVAIITDVTHDTGTPHMNMKKLGDVKCGKGPAVTYAPAVHNILRELILDTAGKCEIPVQLEAASRSTGTDTDAFAYSNGGVPSALISIPLRYMHTTVEMAHSEDVHHVIRLIFETLQRIEYKHSFRYF